MSDTRKKQIAIGVEDFKKIIDKDIKNIKSN